MKKLISILLILVFITGCSPATDTKPTEKDGVYIDGRLSYHVFFESESKRDLDKDLIGSWHNKDNSVSRFFYHDGTYVWLINAENAGAIINSGTWTSDDDVLKLSLNQYNKTTKELEDNKVEVIYTYKIEDDLLTLNLEQNENLIEEMFRFRDNLKQ